MNKQFGNYQGHGVLGIHYLTHGGISRYQGNFPRISEHIDAISANLPEKEGNVGLSGRVALITNG